MNVARSLGIPRDLDGAADIIAAGNVRTIDVGEAKGQHFLEVGSVGLNAAIFADAQRFDKGDYGSFFGLLRTILQYRPARMRIHLDDRVVRRRALMIVVANGPYGGLGFTFAPDATFDDGLFDVRVYSRFSKTELLLHMWSIMLGRRAYTPKVHTYRSARVRIEAAHPHPVRVDASDLGTTPVTFRTRPASCACSRPRPERRRAQADADRRRPMRLRRGLVVLKARVDRAARVGGWRGRGRNGAARRRNSARLPESTTGG